MIEISVAIFALLAEGLAISLIALIVIAVLSLKRRKRDRVSASKLIDQLKHQSETRLDATGSFLSEKYRFEGNELKKAVERIDKEEKKFFQILLDVYLKRDADKLESMDATLAELIDTYKSLSPVMPENGGGVPEEVQQELDMLRESNANLREELSITKETMGNMISEFGNMFGGGRDHEMANHEVVEKVQERKGGRNAFDESPAATTVVTEEVEIEVEPESPDTGSVDDEIAVMEMQEAEDSEALDMGDDLDDGFSIVSEEDMQQAAAQNEAEPAEIADDADDVAEDVLTDEGIDELLNGIDLSEEDEKPAKKTS